MNPACDSRAMLGQHALHWTKQCYPTQSELTQGLPMGVLLHQLLWPVR
jgi:hypothetical protein